MDSLLGGVKSNLGLLEFFVSIVFSLGLGVVVLVVYRMYFLKAIDRNESLCRSFVFIAPAVTAIFWAIQYSLPLSLGLLGALSFVRFRTPIKRSEDIGFILLVIALALLSSIYRFFAAGILLLVIILAVGIKTLLSKKAVALLKPGTNLTIFVSTRQKSVDVFDKELRREMASVLSGLGYRLALADVTAQEQGYALRYSLFLRAFDDKMIPLIIGGLNRVSGIERPEVFVEKPFDS